MSFLLWKLCVLNKFDKMWGKNILSRGKHVQAWPRTHITAGRASSNKRRQNEQTQEWRRSPAAPPTSVCFTAQLQDCRRSLQQVIWRQSSEKKISQFKQNNNFTVGRENLLQNMQKKNPFSVTVMLCGHAVVHGNQTSAESVETFMHSGRSISVKWSPNVRSICTELKP